MPNETWPEAIREALFDARIDEDLLQADCWAEEITAFVEHWGSVDADACKRALAGENAYERLFALFALGALAPTEVEALLLPFLHSPVRKECWASAIVLGRYKHEQAFPLLLAYLPEQLACTPYAFPDEDGSLDPLEVTSEAHEHARDSEWYFLQRYEIALLLGAYEDPRAIPVLAHTFQTGLMFEFATPGWVDQGWYLLEDRLAYALGQLGAWHVLDELALPPKRLLVARMYLVLGSFRASVFPLFSQINLGIGYLSLLHKSLERPEYINEMGAWEMIGKSPAQRKALRELPSLALLIPQRAKQDVRSKTFMEWMLLLLKLWRERRQKQGVRWYLRPLTLLVIGMILFSVPLTRNAIVFALTVHHSLPSVVETYFTFIDGVALFSWLAIVVYVAMLRVQHRQEALR